MCSPPSITSPPQRGTGSLLFCAAGICGFYLWYGYLQEKYFSGPNRIPANFCLVSQTATNALVALVWARLERIWSNSSSASSAPPSDAKVLKDKQSLNHKLFLLTAFFYISAMSLSNCSFQYVSYPTAVLAKSCKLIPTMVMSFLIERKNYKLQEWMAALCITIGIVLFNLSRLADKKQGQEDSIHGIVLLLSSLLMDGFLGACQGLMKNTDTRYGNTQRPPTAMETMFYLNLYALVWLLPMAWGEIQEGLDRLEESLEGMLLLNAAAASGQIFIFITLTWFSSLVTTTITTTRKFFTILLSVLHFGHVFTMTQWTSIGLVFGGLYLGIATKASQTHNSTVGKKKVE